MVWPADALTPVYAALPEIPADFDYGGTKRFEDLPEAARSYVGTVEEHHRNAVRISERLMVLVERGYNIIPILPGKKRPPGNDWQKIQSTPELVTSWIDEMPQFGIGVLASTTCAVDIDCRDKAGEGYPSRQGRIISLSHGGVSEQTLFLGRRRPIRTGTVGLRRHNGRHETLQRYQPKIRQKFPTCAVGFDLVISITFSSRHRRHSRRI
jgi:hypothetical protein